MRLVVILLVSFVARILGDVLHVQCGDETCSSELKR
jgi:hypothetical protein